MNICIIPARGGSNRIKNKNIKKFNGKPIIGIVLKNLKKSKLFKKIIVSTDSKKISDLSKKYGADLILRRNKKLSKNHIGSCQIISDAIRKIELMNIFPSNVFCVYPTSVFFRKTFNYIIKKLKYKSSLYFQLLNIHILSSDLSYLKKVINNKFS